MRAEKSRAKKDKLVALTRFCPASKSLGLCALIRAPGDSAVQRWVGIPAQIGWLKAGMLRGFRHQMRVVLDNVSPIHLMVGLIRRDVVEMGVGLLVKNQIPRSADQHLQGRSLGI